MKNTDIECIIVIPENSPKRDHFKRLNATVQLHGTDCLESEMFARQYAEVSICTLFIIGNWFIRNHLDKGLNRRFEKIPPTFRYFKSKNFP